ncbi:hypothetical protein CR983_03350 [Candidatus Saccharibacteria bacterium]|nr:MAG: hypothetical protein CR983_03350 [Candidatus Saccharibacteria bacterium]
MSSANKNTHPEHSEKRGRPPKHLAGLLLAATVLSGCIDTPQDSAATDGAKVPAMSETTATPSPEHTVADVLPWSVQMSGPESPTDDLARQLQLAQTLREISRNGDDFVSKDTLSDTLLDQDTAPIANRVIGSQALRFIAAYPPDRETDIETLMPNTSPDDIRTARAARESAIYNRALDDIASNRDEPESMAKSIQNTDVAPSKDFSTAASLADAVGAFSGTHSLKSAHEAANDVASSTNPDIKRISTQYVEYYTVKDITDRYSYADISRQDAEQALAGITDNDLKTIATRLLDATDHGDGSLQRTARSELWQVISDTRQSSQELLPTFDEFRRKKLPPPNIDKIREDQKRLVDDYDKKLRAAVVEYNASIAPRTLSEMPAFDNGYKTLDLSRARSEKTITTVNKDKQLESLHRQVAEVYADGSSARLHFETTANLSEKTQKDLEMIYSDVQPMAEAAMHTGALLNIRFVIDGIGSVTDNDFDGYYYPYERAVYIILPANDSVSFDTLRQILVHELTHALIEDAYSGAAATDREIGQMQEACAALSRQARAQFELSMQDSLSLLDTVTANTTLTESEREVFRTLKDYLQTRTLNQHSYSHARQYNNFSSGCEAPSLYAVINTIATTINNKNINDSDSSAQPASNVATEAMLKKLGADKNYGELAEKWRDAINYESLYAKYNESSRVDSASSRTTTLGHSQERHKSGTEMPASLMSGLLSDTEYMQQLFAQSSPDERKIIEQSLTAVTDILERQYPTIAGELSRCQAKVVNP